MPAPGFTKMPHRSPAGRPKVTSTVAPGGTGLGSAVPTTRPADHPGSFISATTSVAGLALSFTTATTRTRPPVSAASGPQAASSRVTSRVATTLERLIWLGSHVARIAPHDAGQLVGCQSAPHRPQTVLLGTLVAERRAHRQPRRDHGRRRTPRVGPGGANCRRSRGGGIHRIYLDYSGCGSLPNGLVLQILGGWLGRVVVWVVAQTQVRLGSIGEQPGTQHDHGEDGDDDNGDRIEGASLSASALGGILRYRTHATARSPAV